MKESVSIFKRYTSFDKEKSLKFSKDLLKVVIGGMILGLAYAKWMVPNQVINGGATSLALILESLTGMSVTFYSQLLTVVFLVLSFIFLGGKNFVLSIISSFSYTFFFSFYYNTSFSLQTNIVIDIMLACITIALGYYLCISAGASTVGIEVIALIIKKRNDSYDLVKLIRLLNYSVLVAGLLVYGIKSVIIGLIFSYVYSAILNKLLNKKKEN